MQRMKQGTIVVVLAFVLLAILNKPTQTSSLVQDIAHLVGNVFHNAWEFIRTLYNAATDGKK